MMRPRGRPPRADTPVSRDEMIRAALDLLNHKGADAFTMRALAERLHINPMTIHHHFGGRDGLIGAMSEWTYARVVAPDAGTPTERMRALLRSYHEQVLRHPGLTMLIFSRPAVFPEQARRITGEISALLADAGLTAGKARLWIAILVDFTHGAALAIAMSGGTAARTPAVTSDYDEALTELMSGYGP